MRLTTLHISTLLIGCWFLLTNHRDPNNPPVARTGAPGETTCGASGCHTGGAFTGTVAITGIPDTVTANQSYTVTLTNTSNAVRAGFQLTCLDGANAYSGTLTNGTGTSIGTSNSTGRKYIRQSSPKTISVILKGVSSANEPDETSVNWVVFKALPVRLDISLLESASGHLDIYDLQGRIVHTIQLNNENHISTDMLVPGIYIARVQAGGKVFAVRFVR